MIAPITASPTTTSRPISTPLEPPPSSSAACASDPSVPASPATAVAPAGTDADGSGVGSVTVIVGSPVPAAGLAPAPAGVPADVAVNRKRPEIGCPSAEVTRQVTVYRPAG